MTVDKHISSEKNIPALPLRDPPVPRRPGRMMAAWEAISRAGLAEIAFRLGTHVLLMAIILIFAWGLRHFYTLAQVIPLTNRSAALAISLTTPTPSDQAAQLPVFESQSMLSHGVPRQASLHTDLPSRPRFEVVQYTVQTGDSVFSVADKFGLKPESILWANQSVLGDNPHNLRPGQVLTILPVDGAYHRWSAADGLNAVAKFFNVSPEDILSFPGNHLKPEEVGDWSNPNIPAGSWLIIPGGRREFVSWSVPEIPRDDPEVGKILGTGTCDVIPEGPVGSGIFIWPADAHFLSGYEFSPNANHFGVDIDGEQGDPVYAVDSGVIVYAGWNDWGYGNMIVVNHGNDWQTLYAHLSDLFVNCGQTVWQGSVIGAIGATGSASGSHLHFEMMYKGTKINPLAYLP